VTEPGRDRPGIGRRGARAAVAFLTVVPVGGGQPSGAALWWFPVVGLGLGAVLGGLWWAMERAWSPLLAAGVVVAADAALTGGLHLDGLADSADGLLPHLGRDRRLAVMHEPGVGAFGVVAVGAALLLRFAALASMRPSPLVLMGLWCASRGLMAVTPRLVPYARDGGLAQGFLSPRGRVLPLLAVTTLGSVGPLLAWRVVPGLASLAGAVVAASVVVALAGRRIGGFTGDVLGAAGVVGETVGLVLAAARW
jgi:adenosylcobinamide-GDP ribazoletransferase